jgi:hypothetical protein
LGIPTVHCADNTVARFTWPRLAVPINSDC